MKVLGFAYNIFVFTVIFFIATSISAFAICTKDTDCKGDRICDDGKCVNPTSSQSNQNGNSASITGEFPGSDGDKNRHETKFDLINSEYGRGVDKFVFGMSTDEINNQLQLQFRSANFSSLPIAGEYKTAEVRYFWQNIKNFPQFPNHELFTTCDSGSSYVCFLFDKNGLFRISLRLMNDCKVRKEVVRQVAEIYGLEMKAESFRHQNGDVIFYGANGNDLSQLEWVRRGSPKYSGQDW